MEADRGVQDLVMAIGRLRDAGLEARLLVCGKRNAATSLEHDWIDYRGMVPHADMPMYLNAMDVLAIPYRLSPFMDMGASCKIAEYLMCERPVASTRTPNFTGNFPRQAAQLGTAMCEPENVVDLARVIRSQLERPIVASAPTEFTWPGIAARALAAIDAASRIH
jgi:glycosyltransferase involved in cell wall biosynthesis